MRQIAAKEVILQVAKGVPVCSVNTVNNMFFELENVNIGSMIQMLQNSNFQFFIDYSKDEKG